MNPHTPEDKGRYPMPDKRTTVTTEVCLEEAKLGHETVRCTVDHKEGEPHVNDCFGVWPPCPRCSGLEDHSPTCPKTSGFGRTSTWATVTWATGGKPRVRCGRRVR